MKVDIIIILKVGMRLLLSWILYEAYSENCIRYEDHSNFMWIINEMGHEGFDMLFLLIRFLDQNFRLEKQSILYGH